MTAPISGSDSRFTLESHNHAGQFLAALPYRNIQMEMLLNERGHALRCEIPFRNYKQVTQANLYPGKHEIWLWDRNVSTVYPIWAGPLWEATISSSTGVISCSAQDPISYLAKRILYDNQTFVAQQPADMINTIMGIVNSVKTTYIVSSKITSNTSTASTVFKGKDNNIISDLIQTISLMADGTDYYVRHNGTSHILKIYGGKIKPTSSSFGIEYGGALNGYSLQYNAQPIGNDVTVANGNGVSSFATNPTNQTNYDAAYQIVERGSDLTSTVALATAAGTKLKVTAITKVIPTVTTRALTPIKDFDFGTQFTVVINDEYAQYSGLVRVVGWQQTIGSGDQISTNIYVNNLSEVT